MEGSAPQSPAGPSHGNPWAARLSWAAVTVLVLSLAASTLWLKTHQGIDPAADPNWVPAEQLQQAREQLARVQQRFSDLEERHRRLADQLAGLQRRLGEQNTQLRQTIRLTDLPVPLRGDTPADALQRIAALQQQADEPVRRLRLLESTLTVLLYLQEHGVIDTRKPLADAAVAQALEQLLGSQGVSLTPDGDQPPAYAGLTAFQNREGLKVDGKLGMQTFTALVRRLQEPASGPTASAAASANRR